MKQQSHSPLPTLLRLLRNWTLPVAIAVGSSLYLLFAFTPALEEAAVVLGPLCQSALPVSIFFTLFITFAKVDYHLMRLRRWHVAILALQLLFIGTLTWAIHTLSHSLPSPAQPTLWGGAFTLTDITLASEAMLVCVIAPCAVASPVVTAKLGGDLTQMTTFVLLSSVAMALLIPYVFTCIEPQTDVSFAASFLALLRRLATVLLLPLLLGAVVRHWVSGLRQWLVRTPNLSFYCWCFSLSITAGITVKNIVHSPASPALLMVIAVLSLLTSLLQFRMGRAIGRKNGEHICTGQAMFQKNTALAIWAANTYLNPVASIGAGCYVLWQNLINSFELWQHRRKG